MTKCGRRLERTVHIVFAVCALLWVAGAVVIVAWNVIHPPVTLHGVKK